MSRTFTSIDFHQLGHLFAAGKILEASKRELEEFAVMLCQPNAYAHFSSNEYQQITETVRTLLIVRMSEEANEEATRISKIALWVAMAALGGTLIQVLLTLWPK